VHRNFQAQLSDYFLQPLHSPSHRIQQEHHEIWPSERERDAWQTRARPYVQDPATLGEKFAEHSGVEHVAFPQPARFRWADEAPAKPGSGEQLDVPLR
jgi:hypothetical protein